MNHNWNIRDLVSRLKTQQVLAKDLKRGDIIADNIVWAIENTKKIFDEFDSRTYYEVLDEDGNGVNYPSDSLISIIDRSCLRGEFLSRR